MSFTIEAIEFQLGELEIDLSSTVADFQRTFEKTGISKTFHTIKPVYQMGVIAAKRSLEIAGRAKNEIRFLIYVTQSSSKVLPGDSVYIHRDLGLSSDVALFDINAGCSGFTQAIILASNLVNTIGLGLIVCSDAYRNKLDPNDRSTNAVFSDAGSAVIIAPGDQLNLVMNSFQVESESGPEYLVQEHFGGFLKMNGPALWLYTRGNVVKQINKLIENAHNNRVIPDTLYMHQASKLVVEGVASKIISESISIPQNFAKYGNCVSSSLPILMKNDISKLATSVSILAGFGVGVMSVCLILKGNKA
jgi:3-oxoacyl-[acyl-carrier-protein] synthase-3